MRFPILLTIIIGIYFPSAAQSFKFSGRITNASGEPVALVSVQVKGWQSGTLSKEDGRYELTLEEGSYEIVFSMVGYRAQVIPLVVTKDYIQDILLDSDASTLQGVVIKGRYHDGAAEIIKNVIRRKDSLQLAIGNWSGLVYIKAVQQDSSTGKSKSKPVKDSALKNNMKDPEIAGMAMMEISVKLDFGGGQKIREERMGVKKAGNPEDLFYQSVTEGMFNFYQNLLKIPGLSSAQFLSPVSLSGLIAYRFKTIRIEKKGSDKWYTIGVHARQMSNATIDGEITISDRNWTIQHARFSFPKFHLPQYDFFEVEQWFDINQGGIPLLSKELFNYNAKSGKSRMSGHTTVVFADYELNKTFPRNYFGNEVSATAEEAYKRDSSFWQQARTEPLTPKEIKFIHYKDSLFRVTTSKPYLDSIDHQTNRFTWKKLLFFGQTLYNRDKERTWLLPSLPGFYQPLAFGGMRISPTVGYYKTYKNKHRLNVFANLSYGFRNHDINGFLSMNKMYNPFNRAYYQVTMKRDFDFIYQGDAWINMLKRSNQFLNNEIGIRHGREFFNGFFIHAEVDFAIRKSLNEYKTGTAVDSLLSGLLKNNQAVAFDSYNALYGKISLEYTPFQRYIREPREKIILGSNWPTIYTSWRKGLRGPLKSTVDFDYWEAGLRQEIGFGLFGILHYDINTGTFLNRRDLRLVDYKFQRRGDPLLFMNPDHAFQALDSTFPVFNRFYQAHFIQEFNGYFINKVPLLKKLRLREIAGAGFLSAPERHLRYVETFVGLERVFKWPFDAASKFKLGVYVVGSAANKFTNPVTFKIGVTSWDKRSNRWF